MARKSDPESIEALSSAPAEVATVAAVDAVAEPIVGTAETADHHLTIQPDPDAVRAWLETPEGELWLQDYQLKQIEQGRRVRPADPADLASHIPTQADVARVVGVEPGQVLGWRDYGDRLVVVTTDGRKLEAAHAH